MLRQITRCCGIFRCDLSDKAFVVWFKLKMNYFEKPANLKLLQDLLKEPDEGSTDSEPDDRVPIMKNSISIRCQKQSNGKTSSDCGMSSKVMDSCQRPRDVAANSPQTLSEWEEQENLLNDSELEHRETPDYRIVYKQSVTPEDVYLQMGNKTAATSSCEEMCLEILMPKETVSIDRMQLDVSSDEVDLQTPAYRFKLPLVQQIDPDHGKASWDDKEKILRLTLRMKREYDFINF